MAAYIKAVEVSRTPEAALCPQRKTPAPGYRIFVRFQDEPVPESFWGLTEKAAEEEVVRRKAALQRDADALSGGRERAIVQ